MQSKELTAKVYEATGLNQQDLAALLGTSQSNLSRYEKGIRGLASEPLRRLAIMYDQLVKMPEPSSVLPTEEQLDKAAQEAQWSETLLYLAQQKLEEAQQGYKQGATMLQWLTSYTVEAGHSLTEKQQRWVQTQEYEARQRMAQNNWLVQRQLAIHVAQLQQQVMLYRDGIV